MYKVYTIGRKGGICSLVPRQEGPLVSVDRGVRRNLGEGEEEREGASLCVDREVRRKVEGKRMTGNHENFVCNHLWDLLVPGVPTL